MSVWILNSFIGRIDLHRGAYICKMFAQSVFPGSVVDGSYGPDSDIRHDSGPIPHAIGPSQRHILWQPWKIMVMMNKPLSDRSGTSQILPPTLSRKGMTLWCSSVDNWWSVLIRFNMSEAMRRHWEVRQAGWFFFFTGVCRQETCCIQL